ncbi:DUF7024 domain-containing protein [Usitatibacter palustris]|uniref:Phosphoglycerol transferase I n=1 Tax=Usitatibacter palustris TaxID=2732487 RepID=A0A6M4HD74_9PROT|nr:hypothetical protein [Usitatibacter palustris]QJR16504.1 Phosphoglycerol transferase I [Usitatibacter palustris]
MNKKSFAEAVFQGAVLVACLASCSDEPDAKRPPAPAAAPAAPAPVASGGSPIALGPRHEATLAEGIDFTKPGFPGFLKEVKGVSGAESWGRWTDANLAPAASFRFDRALPKSFTLELKATGLGPNAYQPVKIRAGSVERTLTLGNPAKASYRVEFSGVDVDTIEIVPPAPIRPGEVSPQNPDTRKLGLGLTSLKIQN